MLLNSMNAKRCQINDAKSGKISAILACAEKSDNVKKSFLPSNEQSACILYAPYNRDNKF